MAQLMIKDLEDTAQVRTALAEILIEVVAAGSSVHFMHPLNQEDADAFWDSALTAAARRERIILGAWDGSLLVGTVTLQLHCPPNQPHRGEIAKMMTRLVAETRDAGLSILRLETGNRSFAAISFYRRSGFRTCPAFEPYAHLPPDQVAGSVFLERVVS